VSEKEREREREREGGNEREREPDSLHSKQVVTSEKEKTRREAT